VLDAIRYNGASWVKAQANVDTTLALGIVTEVTNTDVFTIALTGRFEITHGLTPDEWYFLSDATPGALTPTEPAISQPIVYVEDTAFLSVYSYRPSTTGVGLDVPPGGANGQTQRHTGVAWVSTSALRVEDNNDVDVTTGTLRIAGVPLVDGAKTFEVVNALPGTPDNNVIYFVRDI